MNSRPRWSQQGSTWRHSNVEVMMANERTLKGQIQSAQEEIRNWPTWMKEAAYFDGIDQTRLVDGRGRDVDIEKRLVGEK